MNGALTVIRDNLAALADRRRALDDITAGQLGEAAALIASDALAESRGDKTAALLSLLTGDTLYRSVQLAFGDELRSRADYDMTALLCRFVAEKVGGDISDALDISSGRCRTVLRPAGAGPAEAAERFAAAENGARAREVDSYAASCDEAASNGEAAAVLPIVSSSDGLLNQFYRLADRYDLKIALITDVLHADGGEGTRFALMTRTLRRTESDNFAELAITPPEDTDAAALFAGAALAGARAQRITASPSVRGVGSQYNICFLAPSSAHEALMLYFTALGCDCSLWGFYSIV